MPSKPRKAGQARAKAARGKPGSSKAGRGKAPGRSRAQATPKPRSGRRPAPPAVRPPPGGWHVDPAGPRDLEAIWPHLVELHAHENVPQPGEAVLDALRRLLVNEQLGKAFLVREGDAVVAYLVLTASYSLEYGGDTLLVDELFVRDDRRGLGLGSMLLDAGESYAAARGIRALLLEVGTGNKDAHRLYERRGYTHHDRHLIVKRLDP